MLQLAARCRARFSFVAGSGEFVYLVYGSFHGVANDLSVEVDVVRGKTGWIAHRDS